VANEVKMALGITGHTLRFTARQPDGTLRGTANQAVPEVGTTGYYTATPSTALVAGDMVILEDQTAATFYQGEYKTAVVSTEIEAKVDTLISNAGKVLNITEQKETDISQTKARIYI
jgi:hypothetical protein